MIRKHEKGLKFFHFSYSVYTTGNNCKNDSCMEEQLGKQCFAHDPSLPCGFTWINILYITLHKQLLHSTYLSPPIISNSKILYVLHYGYDDFHVNRDSRMFYSGILLKTDLWGNQLMEKERVWEETHCSNYLDINFYVITETSVSCCHLDFIDVT